MNSTSQDTPISIPPIADPSDHVRVLHADALKGTVAVIQRDGRWRERPVPLRDLDRYVRSLPLGPGSPDTYMSQGRFAGRRLVARLITISSLWVDLDFYTMSAFASGLGLGRAGRGAREVRCGADSCALVCRFVGSGSVSCVAA